MTARAERTDDTRPRIMVLGGGVAGLTAAVRLHDDFDAHVTLIEARNRLGGRATSFDDPKTGRIIDNCQHILMRCCTNLIDFYRRLGVIDQIRWHTRFNFAHGTGCIERFERTRGLPAPFHLTPALFRLSAFTFADKLAIARAMRAIINAGREDVRNITFESWLRAHDQSHDVIRRFWDIIITSACNLRAGRVGVSHALQVFQEGFLNHESAYVMGVASCPLRDLYEPAADRIDDLRMNTRVRQIHADRDVITSIGLSDGSVIKDFDAVICALPFEVLPNVFGADSIQHDSRLRAAQRLEISPILGVHLWFDRSITDLPHVAFLDREVQWIFLNDRGRYAHAVISAADEWVNLDRDEIVDRVLTDLQPFFANATYSSLREVRVIKERRATFAATPGSDDARPHCRGAIRNLFLAGDYTQTGWPATMEGAARSGYLAAFEAMRAISRRGTGATADATAPPIIPDLRVAPLVKVLRAIPLI